MRVPAGQMVADTFRALGAEPITINSDGIYAALESGRVDAQENPLALMELFKLDEVVKYVSMTNHMWSGFNLLAHQPTWARLPADIRTVVERNVAKHVRLQRRDQAALNAVGPRADGEARARVQRDRSGGVPGAAVRRLRRRGRTGWEASAGRCSRP